MLRVASVLFRIGVVVVFLAVGYAVFSALASMREAPESVVDPTPPLSVVTVQVQPVPVPRVWSGFGTARPMDEADVSAQVSARVIDRPDTIEPGNRVEAGDVLVRLDPIDFELRAEASRQAIAGIDAELDAILVDRERLGDQITLAREQADIAKREYERFLDAQSDGVANQIELDARMTALRRAERDLTSLRQSLEQLPSREASLAARRAGEEANLRIALENLARTTVASPIAGVLQEVFAEPGELLPVGAPVARVVSLDRVEVPVRLPVSSLGSVGVGDAARLAPDGPDDAVWDGRVSRIAPEADAASRTVAVFVEVDQAGAPSHELLRPGRYVNARVTTRLASERVLVPRRAILDDTVFLANDDPTGSSEHPLIERVGVDVLFHTTGSFPGLDPRERQWSVLDDAGALVGRRVVTTNLDRLVIGAPVRATDAHELRDPDAEARGRAGDTGVGSGS